MRKIANFLFLFFIATAFLLNPGCSGEKNTCTVADFGAAGDGKSLDTDAINRAIASCSERGGGTILFPAGTYLSGSINLQSNITLLFEKGATLLGAPNDINAYDHPEPNPWDKYQDFGHSHFRNALMWGEHLENITIIGPGTINGGGITRGDPDAGGGDKAISLKLCKNITIENIAIENGGHFAVLANGCSNMTFRNLTIRTSRDGIDLMACSDVLIEKCDIRAIRYDKDGNMAGGDDAIGIKSDYALGYKLDCENITIRDCFLSSGCNTIQFGSETVGNIRNVHVSNITIEHADKAGLGITSNDGSLIENVTYKDITMSKVANPIFINISNRGRAPGNPPIGRIRNIEFENISVTDAYGYIKDRKFTSTISGLPGHPVENVQLKNVSIVYKGGGTKKHSEIQVPYPEDYSPRHLGIRPAYGFFLRHIKDIAFHNVSVDYEKPDLRPALVEQDVDGLLLKNFHTGQSADNDHDFIFKSGDLFHGSRK